MHKLFIGITIGAALLTAQQKGDRAELQLQAAINKEVVEGDLKGAIEQYRKAAQSANRAVAAKALVRMGQCYEKLGDGEARKAYERVMRDFADQKDLAAEARTRLASLGSGERQGPPAVTMRRLSAGRDPDNEGRPSPDGEWLSYTSPDGDLALYSLHTGERRMLKRNAPNPSGKPGWVEESIWSPDGKQIAYGWDYCGPDCVELRVIQADGSGDRTLYRNDKLYYVQPFDWSPDGKYISAALIRNGLARDLALVDARTGDARALKAFPPNQQPLNALFSPDGRYLAYDVQQQPGNPHRDIWLMSLDGSQTSLVQNPANDQMLAWVPEGALFASDRTGSTDIWLQPVANGKPQGPPERVKAGIGNFESALGLTRKGSLYYSVSTAVNDVLVASLDPATGKAVSRGLPVSQRHAGQYGYAAWSPDGKRLASLAKSSSKGPFQIIVLQEMATGEERDLNPGLPSIGSINWTPDGQSLLAVGTSAVSTSNDKRWGIFKIDPRTGEAAPMVTSAASLGNPQLSPDGKVLYYAEISSGQRRVLALDLSSGNQRVALDSKRDGDLCRYFALSPDGERITFPWGDNTTGRVLVAPAKGGEARPLHETKDGLLQYFGLTWSPDGRYVLFVERPEVKSSSYELWRVPVQGGQAEKLGLAAEGLHTPRVHPAGTRIAYGSGSAGLGGTGVNRRGSEVWVLENFLPPRAATH